MPLDAKEVERRGKDLAKAQQTDNNQDAILSILSELKTGVQPTEELLRSTKIGMIVNRLKTYKDPAVARSAAEIVTKWRNEVKKPGANGSAAGGASGSSTPKGSLGAGAARNGTASPAPGVKSPAPAVKSGKKSAVAPDKRSAQADGISCAVTGNKMRDNCVKMMYDGLAFMSEDDPDSVLIIAREIESAAYATLQPETSDAYKSKMRSLFQNLKNKSNPQLRVRILNGSIAPAQFTKMSHEEMKSKEMKAEDAALQKENMRTAMVAQEEKSVSSQLKCGKCGMRKVSYTQAQTRSADEPMTTFCECMNCGNRWKFS